jgi:CRISP-associated protein Cas1
MDPDPPLRVMALHALAYCERLFYLEEVEEIRIADEAVYAGRRLHEELTTDEGELVSMVLESEVLGLRGKVDCLRRRDGRLIPYEHKRGHAAKGAAGPEAWPSDRLQASAYALLLEEQTGSAIEEARIRYHADNVTVRVPIDTAARETVAKAMARARELRESVERPPVTQNDRLCLRCSLAPVCLPEEERLAAAHDQGIPSVSSIRRGTNSFSLFERWAKLLSTAMLRSLRKPSTFASLSKSGCIG